MRAVIASDLHLDNWKEFSTDDGGYNSRLMHGIYALQQIRDYMNENKITYFLFLGDLFHRGHKIEPDILELAINILRNYRHDRLKVYGLVGQHDQANATGSINAVAPLKDYLRPFSQACGFELEGVRFAVCPCRRGLRAQYEELAKIPEDEYDVFLGHFLVKQLIEKDGMETVIEAVDFKAVPDYLMNAKYWFMGDYHPKRDAGKIVSVGAMIGHTFGDIDHVGRFIDMDFTTGERIDVDIDGPVFRDYEFDQFMDVLDGLSSGDYYRIRIRSQEEQMEVVSKTGDGWHLRFVFEQQPTVSANRISVNTQMEPGEVVDRYVESIAEEVDWVSLKRLGREYL